MTDKTAQDKAATEAAEKKAENKTAEGKSLKGQALINAGCKAYGIDAEFLFNSRVDGDEVVLVTNGGKKVRYKSGDEVEPLDEIAVTGVNPAAKKRKVIAGKKK